MRIGIFGGTFDPVHLGHLRAAENAREALGLDTVLLVPAGTPPHRPKPLAGAMDRFHMACLASAPHRHLAAIDDEIRREGPSYTVDTVELLAARFPGASLHLLVGSDTLPDVASWRDAPRLLALCRLAVAARPGAAVANAAGIDHDAVEGPVLDVSATALRARAALGKSVRFLVPDAVADYIETRGLYR